MLCQVTSKDYPIHYPLTESSSASEADTNEILDRLSSNWIRKNLPKEFSLYSSLSPLLDIDLSSVSPHFEIRSETSMMQEAVAEELLEYDIVVRIPPKRRYIIELTVKNIRKAEPRIVEPEAI